MSRGELMEKLWLKDRMHFCMDYLHPSLAVGLIEMTIPDKPRSSKQKYRLTDKGRQAERLQEYRMEEKGRRELFGKNGGAQ